MAAGTVRMFVGVLFGVVVVAAVASPAAAHTALKDSDPKTGGRVSTPPKQVSLEFTEALRASLTKVVVQGPGGGHFESGPPQVGSATVVQPLRALGAAGEYQIVYRVVADDGHPLTGTVRFTLTAAAGSGSGTTGGATASSSAVPAPGSTAGASSAAPVGATGDAGGGASPGWIVAGAIAAVVFIAGAVWFGRRATRDFE